MEGIWGSLIGDMCNFHLAIVGILVSMMTLLYASLSSKVEELNSIKQSEEYALTIRSIAISNSIGRLRKLNKQVMIGLIISFCLFVLTTIIKYLLDGCVIKWIAVFSTIIAIITIGLLAFGVKLAYGICSQYQKETF